MNILKVKSILFSLMTVLVVSVFMTSCEQGDIATIKDSNKVDAYIALLGDENASIDEAHELYLTLNSEELIEANNIVIEKAIEQARQENDEVALNFFTQNQNTFSKFYNAIETQAVELYGMSSNQLDSEILEGLYELETSKLNFVPFEEIENEQAEMELRACQRHIFPEVICQGGSMNTPSNFSYDGTHDDGRWTCDWVFNFHGNYYTIVNSNHWYVSNRLAAFGHCGMRARYIWGGDSWNRRTELILGKLRFGGVGRGWVQSQLRMGW